MWIFRQIWHQFGTSRIVYLGAHVQTQPLRSDCPSSTSCIRTYCAHNPVVLQATQESNQSRHRVDHKLTLGQIVLAMEAIGDITATCDVSRLQVDGPLFDSRIQGGVLADGLNGIIAGLATITPMSTFAQNNGVIALTRCANRKAGYACCFWLLIMGIFAKFAAALVAIPAPILGFSVLCRGNFWYPHYIHSSLYTAQQIHFDRRPCSWVRSDSGSWSVSADIPGL